MIAASPLYLAALNATGKTPIYRVIMTPVGAPEPEYSFCTSHPQSGEDLGVEILVPLELERRANVEECRFALSTFTFELQDVAGAATAIVNAVVGYRCTLYAGFYDLTWDTSPANYVVLFTGIVTEMTQEERVYRFVAQSPMAAANDKTLFNGAATTLVDSVTSTDTTFHVTDASEFETAYPPLNGTGVRVIQVGDGDGLQMYAYTSQALQPDETWNLTGVGRSSTLGFFVPPETPGASKAHEAKSAVYEVPRIGSFAANSDYHPVNIFRSTLTTETGKRGIAEAGVEVNTPQLDDVITQLTSGIQYRFLFREPISAKKFLEEEICATLAGYPTENNLGEIGIKLFPSNVATTVDSIEDEDIVSRPKWLRNAQKAITTVNYYYDYMPPTREFLAAKTYRDQGLIDAIGREITLDIFSRGLRNPYSSFFTATPDFIEERAAAYVNRFRLSAPIISVETCWKKSLLELADDVGTGFSDVPNIITGVVGTSHVPAEIIAIKLRFEQGIVEVELMAIPPITVGLEEPTAFALTNLPVVS